jgi:lysophospholipase L1-like esterase
MQLINNTMKKQIKMHRRRTSYLTGIVTIFIIISTYYLIDRFSYSKKLPFYSVKKENHKNFTIGIIGDSWVAGEKLDTILHNLLLKKGLPNKVISSGHPGAKSKLIYEDLFKEKNNPYSSKFIIESCPDFCLVIAGVNDACSQIGSHFYSYHIEQIIKTLLHYKIKPIIVSLPEFGIEEAIDKMNVFSKSWNIISAYLNNKGEVDNIKTYRKVLTDELQDKRLNDSILLVDFDGLCKDYHKCPELYKNDSHLSMEGNEKLCRLIAKKLEQSKILTNYK